MHMDCRLIPGVMIVQIDIDFDTGKVIGLS